MNLLHQICAGPWLQHLGWTLVHFVWQAFLLGFVLWLILRFVRLSSQVRYVIACASLVLLAMLPVITFIFDAHTEVAPAGSLFSKADSRSVTVQQVLADPLTPSFTERMLLELSRAASWVQPAVVPIALAWLAAMVVLFARQLWYYWLLNRQILRDIEEPDALLQGRFRKLLETVGVRHARLVITRKSEVPATVGWFKPLVLVPAIALTNLPAEYIEALIIHELAHIRRRDYFINILQVVLEHVLFFHPVVWCISAVIRQERENCCDDIASSITGQSNYARALATMEELRHPNVQMAMAATGGSLFDRIARLLGTRPVYTTRSAATGLTVSTLTMILIGLLLVQTARSDGIWWQSHRSRGIGPAIYTLLHLDSDSTEFLVPLSRCTTSSPPKNDELETLASALMHGGDPNAILKEAEPLLTVLEPNSPDGNPAWRFGKSGHRFLLTERMWGRAKVLAKTNSHAARQMARATLALMCQFDAITGPKQTSRLFNDPQFAVVAQLTTVEADRLGLVIISERNLSDVPGIRLLSSKESIDESIRSDKPIDVREIAHVVLACSNYAHDRIWMQRDIAEILWILRSKDAELAAQLKNRVDIEFAAGHVHWRRMLDEAMTTNRTYRPPARSTGEKRAILASPYHGTTRPIN